MDNFLQVGAGHATSDDLVICDVILCANLYLYTYTKREDSSYQGICRIRMIYLSRPSRSVKQKTR